MNTETKTNKGDLILGPLLGVESDSIYTFCILVDSKFENNIPDLHLQEFEDAQITREIVKDDRLFNHIFIRYQVEILPLETEQKVQYSFSVQGRQLMDNLGRSNFSFRICPFNQVPEIVFVSCNGSHNKAAVPPQNYLGYQQMFNIKPHYLFFTGDQVYGDMIYEHENYKKYFFSKDTATDSLQKEIDHFYFELYIRSWNNEHLSLVLASIPNIMSWDDHDIIDGYGSHIDIIHERHKILFKSAEYFYNLFQYEIDQLH